MSVWSLQLSGLALLGVGLWTFFYKHTYISLLSDNLYTVTTYLLIGTGALILIIGIIGCCGATKEHRCCLMTFASLLLVIFILEAVIGVLAYVNEANIHEQLTGSLKTVVQEKYATDGSEGQTEALDKLQQDFRCCGSADFLDWRESHWFLQQPDSDNRTKAPDCCCKTPSERCAVRDHPSNIFYEGCVDAMSHFLQQHLVILGAVGIGVSCLQLFGIIFSCCLAKQIKDQQRNDKANYW